jgi:hypothetical protein
MKRQIQNLLHRVDIGVILYRGPREWRDGYVTGFMEAREEQRNADIKAFLRKFSPTEQTDGK